MTEEHILIIMEYMNGDLNSFAGSFNDILEDEDEEEHPLWQLAKDMSEELDNLHTVGISHNDIKPGNILFQIQSDRTQFKIGDGGYSSISKTLQSLASHTNSGNNQFRPPAISASDNKLDRFQRLSGDVFSIAVLTFYLSTGNYPYGEYQLRINDVKAEFSFNTWASLYGQNDPSSIEKLDNPTIRKFLEKSLKLKPSERMTSREF
mmetsp:Transcript_50560/g.42638  ORF Transcript_50560/g.42638 Transcript_50560/m.42638 type:complete len:206 (+) Transcript_50560:39-656(+)